MYIGTLKNTDDDSILNMSDEISPNHVESVEQKCNELFSAVNLSAIAKQCSGIVAEFKSSVVNLDFQSPMGLACSEKYLFVGNTKGHSVMVIGMH